MTALKGNPLPSPRDRCVAAEAPPGAPRRRGRPRGRRDRAPRLRHPRAPDWQARFLRVFRVVGVRHHAMAAAHIGWKTLETALRTDPEFREAYEEALEASTDALELEATRRAMNRSDPLMMFLLKARRPLIYRDRVEHMNVDVSKWTDRQLEAFLGGQPLREVLALEDGTIATPATPGAAPPGDGTPSDGSAGSARS